MVGLQLENAGLSLLGRPRKVVATKDETTIVDGAGDADQIAARVNQIRSEIERTDSDYDRKELQERPANLARGVAVTKAGVVTEVELNERTQRQGGGRARHGRRRRGPAAGRCRAVSRAWA